MIIPRTNLLIETAKNTYLIFFCSFFDKIYIDKSAINKIQESESAFLGRILTMQIRITK